MFTLPNFSVRTILRMRHKVKSGSVSLCLPSDCSALWIRLRQQEWTFPSATWTSTLDPHGAASCPFVSCVKVWVYRPWFEDIVWLNDGWPELEVHLHHFFLLIEWIPVSSTHFPPVPCRKLLLFKCWASSYWCHSYLPHHLWPYARTQTFASVAFLPGIGVPLTWIYQIAASSTEVAQFFNKVYSCHFKPKHLKSPFTLLQINTCHNGLRATASDVCFGHYSVFKRYPKNYSTLAQFVFCIKWGMFLFC